MSEDARERLAEWCRQWLLAYAAGAQPHYQVAEDMVASLLGAYLPELAAAIAADPDARRKMLEAMGGYAYDYWEQIEPGMHSHHHAGHFVPTPPRRIPTEQPATDERAEGGDAA